MSAITPREFPPVITAKFAKDPALCQWFLKCDKEHTHTRAHSALGDVPLCDNCEEFMQS